MKKQKAPTTIRFSESALKDMQAIINHKNKKYPYINWKTKADLIKYFVYNGINRYKRNNDLK